MGDGVGTVDKDGSGDAFDWVEDDIVGSWRDLLGGFEKVFFRTGENYDYVDVAGQQFIIIIIIYYIYSFFLQQKITHLPFPRRCTLLSRGGSQSFLRFL